uniref:Retrovirus-related Pol polyprotein from transposon TNT 1-94-like beta-barrel domain-containing protein n=1 Tax=Nicotiana tabacum TaxID=4097 RepID=A0A1S3ZRW0_TOBAC|nr:PREDICTED: uncharacterized protein LOC107789679 [Nicotiana tabacum]
MRIVILGNNKIGFIEGTCKKEDYGTNLTDMWERCNVIVLSWIMNCVSSDLLSGIVYSSNACTIWKDLKERFDKVNGCGILQLHRAIATANQGTSSIAIYFLKLRELWVEFDCLEPTLGCDCPKSSEYEVFMCRQKLLQFLMGLNQAYEQAPEQYNQILRLLNKENMPEASANMAGSINAFFVDGNNHEWIIETGATNYMTSNLDILKNKLEVAGIHSKKVHLPNREVSNVTHMESCNIENAGRIDNVLYLPKFKYNLLSVSKIIKELSCCATFYPDFYLLQDLCSGKVKVIGKKMRGLYLLPQITARNNKGILQGLVAKKADLDIGLSHRRLGHAST